jgi:hypothetical protein
VKQPPSRTPIASVATIGITQGWCRKPLCILSPATLLQPAESVTYRGPV